jgi:hypothetical protein
MATAANPPPLPPAENASSIPTAAISLWVAIPDSSISDQQAKRDKSIKIAQFARAFSIFRTKRIYIYHDRTSNINKQDPYILRRHATVPKETIISVNSRVAICGYSSSNQGSSSQEI